jgi:hypothetical protein
MVTYTYLFDFFEQLMLKYDEGGEYIPSYWACTAYGIPNSGGTYAWVVNSVDLLAYVYEHEQFLAFLHPDHYDKVLVDGIPYSPAV